MTSTIRKATADDAGRLAALAAVTFPLACPPSSSPEDIAAHLANTLSEGHFHGYLADPDVTVMVIDAGGALRGYSLLVNRPAQDPDVASALTLAPSVARPPFLREIRLPEGRLQVIQAGNHGGT